MKTHPIIFSAPMIQALLDGRKTQTRRVIKNVDDGVTTTIDDNVPYWCDKYGDWYKRESPYGKAGDLLWVRETFCMYPMAGNDGAAGQIYRADRIVADEALKSIGRKWHPSIFMPRWASRITLRLNDVRVERVQDISFDDAVAEGCDIDEENSTDYGTLWNNINAKRGYPWKSNPWVWVLDFDVFEKNIGEAMNES